MSRFRLTTEPIPSRLLSDHDAAGAIATFEGVVRNHNEGRPVRRLEYEAYGELALVEGERIVAEALGRFPILDAACVHRVGALAIGDAAIRVETAAAHRAEAFRACEWIVEEVKRRVPIWKKERYADGDSGWVNATTPGKAVVDPDGYYARQNLVADQALLSRTRVLVVGAGGLGCPALQYLAGAGIGHLTIVDPDRVEASNLHRQTLYGIDDLGLPKATAAARRLRNLNPFIEIEPIDRPLDANNAVALIQGHDIVMDGTDRLATKFLLNRICVGLKRPLVVASVYRFEGQLQVVKPEGPCLECLWPTPPEDGCVGTCAETGILGVTPGLLGTLQACEILKIALKIPVTTEVQTIDLLSSETRKLKLSRRADCPICGQRAAPLDRPPAPNLEIDSADDRIFQIVDIRESDEVAAHPSGLENIPLSTWSTPECDRPLLLVCASGKRSLALAKRLDGQGVRAFSLTGGVKSLPKR